MGRPVRWSGDWTRRAWGQVVCLTALAVVLADLLVSVVQQAWVTVALLSLAALVGSLYVWRLPLSVDRAKVNKGEQG